MSSKINKQKGYTLLETLIYIFIFSFLALTVVTTLFSLGRAYGRVRTSLALESSAFEALDRMSREIRGATNFGVGGINNIDEEVLTLHTLDADENPITIQFLVEEGRLRIKEEGVDVGPLTSAQVRVTEFALKNMVLSTSTAIRVKLGLESGEGESYKARTFYVTEVLRGSYLNQ